jgi:hypothetical protein
MSTGARVDSLEALKFFKIALVKFGQSISVALDDADSEVSRTLNWLENEAQNYWQQQIRKRHEVLEKAKEALRMKQLYKDASGRTPSAVDEMKAVQVARKRLDDATAKLAITKTNARKMAREQMIYKGQVQRAYSAAAHDVPSAAAFLNNILIKLEQYVGLSAPASTFSTAEGPGIAGMARGAEEAPKSGQGLSHYRKLRLQTPDAMVRDGATPAHPDEVEWKSGIVPIAERDKVGHLQIERGEIDFEHRVILAADVWNHAGIYLHRTEDLPDSPTWYVGPEDGPVVEKCISLSTESLLRLRPDLAEILKLPAGFIVLLRPSGVVSLTDKDDGEHWSDEAAAEATPPAPGAKI